MTSNLDSQLSTITGARQTMSTWAKVIESYGAVPEAYRGSHRMVSGESPQFPYTVLAPPLLAHVTRPLRNCFVKLAISSMYGSVRVIKLLWQRIPWRPFLILKSDVFFCISWITIGGVTTEGEVSSSTIEYNTVDQTSFCAV